MCLHVREPGEGNGIDACMFIWITYARNARSNVIPVSAVLIPRKYPATPCQVLSCLGKILSRSLKVVSRSCQDLAKRCKIFFVVVGFCLETYELCSVGRRWGGGGGCVVVWGGGGAVLWYGEVGGLCCGMGADLVT